MRWNKHIAEGWPFGLVVSRGMAGASKRSSLHYKLVMARKLHMNRIVTSSHKLIVWGCLDVAVRSGLIRWCEKYVTIVRMNVSWVQWVDRAAMAKRHRLYGPTQMCLSCNASGDWTVLSGCISLVNLVTFHFKKTPYAPRVSEMCCT